ncbi:hypothetical protein BDR26DRAFT_395753 [Obelidium mucronatum]|nr:hypothetical protein BDR26DRAFT_395753 [Obelidium mucronatum]
MKLAQIRSINLWGQNLDDVSCLAGLPDLEVVSLPVNRISDLSAFSYLSKLQELYLRKNEISDPRQLAHLIHLPFLKSLWIAENPFCDKIPNYRISMIRLFPNLQKLDDKEVTDRERRDAFKADSASESEGSPVSVSPPKVSPLKPPAPSKPGISNMRRQPQPLNQKQESPFSGDANFFGNVRSIEQRYTQQKASGPNRQSFSDPTSSEDEELRAQIELLQRQRRKTSEPLSKSYDERPLRPAPVKSNDHLIGQGVIGSYDSRIEFMKSIPTSKSKPSYESQILRDKQFQDHLDRGTNVSQVPIQARVDHRKRHDDGSFPKSHLAGSGVSVTEQLDQEQRDFRMRNPDWDNENNHLEGASMHVTNDKEINTDFRRRAFGPFGEGAQHLQGSGANVDFIPHKEHDYRYRHGDLHHPMSEEQHISGSSMAVKVGAEYHDPRLGHETFTNPHVRGSGARVFSEEDYDSFPVMEVQAETIKASKANKIPTNAAQSTKPNSMNPSKIKPEWLKEPPAQTSVQPNVGNATASKPNNNLLLAVLSIVKDLDTNSLQVLQHEVNRLLTN